MASEFDGKVVMISGANGALGQGIVDHFQAAGAKLALLEHHPADVEKTPTQITIQTDVTNADSMQSAVEQAVEHFGQIDIFINTVGGFASGVAVHEVDLNIWDKMMTLNARSVYIACGTVGRYMLENNVQGRMVVVLAKPALKGNKNQSAYSASKAAAQRVIESMAAEMLDHHIRVNGVIPGTIDTPANRQSMPDADFDKWVKPEQIASAIAFLVSDASSAVSGDSLPVYGRS